MLGQLCLVSTSGDMSSRGMGNHNTIYLFPYKYKKQVDDFFKAQCDWDLIIYDEKFGKKGFSSRKHYRKLSDTFHILENLNIFTCKYDFRTSWDMRFFDKIELEQSEPYVVHDNFNIIKNYEKRKEFKIKKLYKKSVCNWFGNRGIDINDSKFTYKAVGNPYEREDWIFIDNKEDDEIELYSLNTDIAECYDGWDKKGFSWAKKNLISLIPKEDNDKWYEKFRIINT